MTTENIEINGSVIHKFLAELKESLNIEAIANLMDIDANDASLQINIAIAEAKQTLSLLEGLRFPRGAKVLEVGAGFGFASLALASLGFKVTALEPGGIGFDQNRIVAAHSLAASDLEIIYLDSTVEDADFSRCPLFDLILSNNVLEHIKNVRIGLRNLSSALHHNGYMVHSCPNYAFPFEPHFGLPLFPFYPSLTSRVLPKKISKSGLWKSLNFITFKDIRKFAKEQKLYSIFEQETMFASVVRLKSDFEFASRHKLISRVVNNVVLFAILKKVLSLPTQIATPMNFILSYDLPDLSTSKRKWRIYS